MHGLGQRRNLRAAKVHENRQQLMQVELRQAGKCQAETHNPSRLAAVVPCSQQALSLCGSDATHGHKRKNGAAIGVHNDLYRMRTRT